jgi:site-specific DNA recombinase
MNKTGQRLAAPTGHVRCAIYARVSTEKQAEHNISIPDQIKRAHIYAKAEGWEVIDVFVDPGASGRDDIKRPEFRRMIAEALKQHKPYDIILVHSFSRFYRDQAKSDLLRRDLKKNRVQVKSCTQEVNDDGGGGTLALSVMGLIDEYQSRETSKHVRRAMEANAREGFRSGGSTPFGYELVEVERRGIRAKRKLAINEAEAITVRQIFEQHQRGLGIKSITTQLNESGSRTRNGNKWSHSTIERLLKNETYVGRNYYKPRDPDTGETVPRKEWVLVPCPAIIEETTFQSVQEQLARRAPQVTAPRHTNSKVLLGGIAHCGSCGRHLQLGTGKGYRYYKCCGKLLEGACEGGNPISIPERQLDSSVLEAIADELVTPERFVKIVSEVHAKMKSDREGASDRAKALRKQLAGVDRKKNNLWEVAASLGLEAVSGFKEKLAELELERDQLSRHIASQEALLSETINLIDRNEAEAAAKRVREYISTADIELLRRFVHAFVARVDVFDDEIRISGQKSTIAEAAVGNDILADMPAERVRGFAHEWRE